MRFGLIESIIRKSDKVSSEGEAFPDQAPEGAPASVFSRAREHHNNW